MPNSSNEKRPQTSTGMESTQQKPKFAGESAGQPNPTENEQEITVWIDALKSGDDEAAAHLWKDFFPRVRGLARRKMGNLPARELDSEDLALSAMNALCAGAKDGRFKQLENRDDLWQILAMLTARKAAGSWRKQTRRKEVGESILGVPGDDNDLRGMGQIADGNDEFIGSLSTVCSELLAKLDDRLREVAMLRLEGYSHEEIAGRLNRSVKSIERYMKMIRQHWNENAG